MTEWKRNCPQCGTEKYYKYKSLLLDAIDNNRICRRCYLENKSHNTLPNKVKCPNPLENPKCFGNASKNSNKSGLCKSCCQYGKEHSNESKMKARNSMMGKNKGEQNGMYGRTIVDTWSDKYGLERANLMYDEFCDTHLRGKNNGFYGKTHSEETKRTISKNNKGNNLGDKNPAKRPDVRRKIRLSRIKQMEETYGQLFPNYNPEACKIIEDYGQEHGFNFQHAENGGEYHIKELGYWVDGYDEEKNIIIEYYEKHHYDHIGGLSERDLNREAEIITHLNCDFYRIHANDPHAIWTELITL